jgi:hypothetical protein
MSKKENGEVGMLPAIAVAWNVEKQEIRLLFDHEQFKTWGFVIAVLEMAAEEAKAKKQMQAQMALQQALLAQAEAQAEEQTIKSLIKLG